MDRTRNRTTIACLLALLLLSPQAYAGRKHSNVHQIGHRKINGRVARIFPNFFSLEKEIELGAEYARSAGYSWRLIEDPAVVSYVDRLTQNLVKHSDAKVPFVVKVVDRGEVNAVALPGGYLFVDRGLILECANEAELAGVLAHEIAHVTARHATERLTKSRMLELALIPATLVGGGWAQLVSLGMMGVDLTVLGITRKSEAEADQLGAQYLWNTGYDPNGLVTFFEKLETKEKGRPGRFASFWRTHPTVKNRVAKVQKEIAVLPEKEEYILNTSEFDRVKARLKEIVDANRPILKRKAQMQRTEQGKPILKRNRPILERKEASDPN